MSKKPNGRKVDPNLRLIEVEPLTKNQCRVFDSKRNQVLHGSAGTGKSLISSYLGYKSVLRKEYSQLVYIRSTVPVRNQGFLPGNIIEKAEVYEQPYAEIATELFARGDAYESLKRSEAVRFVSTSYLRGINLNNSFIVVDECQNMTFQELDTVMTRIGKDSKIFFCGDYYQKDEKDTGIREFYKILAAMDEFDFTNFTIDDVVRSDLVKSYLKHKYDKGNFEQSNISPGRSRISTLIAGRADVQNPELRQSNDADRYPELQPTQSRDNVDSDRSHGPDTCELRDSGQEDYKRSKLSEV